MVVYDRESVSFKWLVTVLLTIVFALVAGWANNLSGQVNKIDGKLGEHISSMAKMEENQRQVNIRLDKIEQRLDQAAIIARRR